MNQVTITLPAIDETVVANLETITTETLTTETEALGAIRAKYSPLARQNGYIQIANYEASDANFCIDKDLFLERGGKRVRALKCFDGFDRNRETQNAGTLDGHRLYLTDAGEWIELERAGRWSAYQGSPNWWGCGEFVGPSDEDDFDTHGGKLGGHVRPMTDAEVAAEYDLDKIMHWLGKSLTTLAEKLPERMSRVRQRAELAAQLLAGLK